MTKILSCETCAYHRDKQITFYSRSNNTIRNWVECHRKPPTVVADGNMSRSMWPHVTPDDFCGEWSATFK